MTIATMKSDARRPDQLRLKKSKAMPTAPPIAASSQRTATAARSERPTATRRCDEWSRPPSEGARPDRMRDAVTSDVSNIGISRTRSGTATIDSGLDLAATSCDELNVSAAKLRPSNRLPLSPMKIFAGWKL